MKPVIGSGLTLRRRTLMVCLLLVFSSLCALTARCQDRDALRHIVQDQCVPHWRDQKDPAPCLELTLPAAGTLQAGYAILHDRKGGAHFLLIPTESISGLESPRLLADASPNYFAAAWQANRQISAVIGHEAARNTIGLAINPQRARSQDQMHIHIECLRPDVIRALRAARDTLSDTWSGIVLGGWHYSARRMRGVDLAEDPIRRLAEHLPDAQAAVGDYTLVVAGMDFTDGPGFAELVSRESAGELLLDSTCAAMAGIMQGQ